jgi:glyoxylase-like metal-dependent hydrolase (beta-lactamase superfamily II)
MIQRWDIVTIGNISRNRYWGERDDQSYRSGICTCTLIRADEFKMLVDPSLTDEKAMAAELDRRTGLKLADIDTIVITHYHGDHHFGLKHFPHARWLAAAPAADAINKTGQYSKKLQPSGERIDGLIDVIHTPGHSMDHHSLRFDCEGMSVVIAADASMTRDFFRHRQGYFNSVDFDLAAKSIDHVARIADIIDPGHDNYFLNRR